MILSPAAVDDLFRRAGAERWSLSRLELEQVLLTSVRHAFAGAEPSPRDVDRYLAGLHIGDLALAAACALGRDAAWDHFVLEYRPGLYRAADALDPSGGVRELADSLYGDLFGMGGPEGDRRSLFRYFHGRSSLATWLRAVLAQRHVDALRAHRRLEPLLESHDVPAPPAPEAGGERSRMIALVEIALRAAIEALSPKDRLRLRSYYVAQLTLAEIGRITGEHEATVSRHLSRTRRGLREGTERYLREESALTVAQAARAVEVALEDPGPLDLQHVFDGESGRKES